MARLRYVRDKNKVKNLQQPVLTSSVQSLRAVYETEPEIAAALLPRPLVPAERPEVFVQHGQTSMHISDTQTITINAATVAVRCSYEGVEGNYVISMPMQGEFVVISGREYFGEPKKIAEIATLDIDGDRINTVIARHGIKFLEMKGQLGESTGSSKFVEYMYCHKALPSITKDGGFDGDVFLTRLNWERDYSNVRTVNNPEIILRDSPYDPLVDVPVKKIVRMEFAEGSAQTSGEILTKIPGEWIEDHIDQRYDDGLDLGIDVSLATERLASNG